MGKFTRAATLSLIVHHAQAKPVVYSDDPKLWERDLSVVDPRDNIYQWSGEDLAEIFRAGKRHTLSYPVSVTGLMIPPVAFKKMLAMNPLSRWEFIPSSSLARIGSLKDFYDFLGLPQFQSQRATRSYQLDRPDDLPAEHRVGAELVASQWGGGLSFSCAACHASNFFGQTVWGLPNKQTRANRIFESVARVAPWIEPHLVRLATQMSENEFILLKRSLENVKSVAPVHPQSLGLDTSLAHVARSLATRNPDAYATKSVYYRRHPRRTRLDSDVADSKPGVFWTLKYKNRWLSDGSVVSGNPIFTNILWNEIGRGSDLHEVEDWLVNNRQKVVELTTAVFASDAPRWRDIFPEKPLQLASAMRGEKLFLESCSGCHGTYEKSWSHPSFVATNTEEIFDTLRVHYHDKTPVVDVDTDPKRYQGIEALADPLNRLEISQKFGIILERQTGYVPPPLVGIFARYPYLHNNSVPNLCALLTPAAARPRTFIQGPSEDATADFDDECVGYPVGKKIPAAWAKIFEARYDTTQPGRSNRGHDFMLLTDDGHERFSVSDKRDLIEFLKTL